MLKALIRNSDFKSLGQFVSPNFFAVVPVGECLKVVSRVFFQAKDSAACIQARQAVQSVMIPLNIEIGDRPPKSMPTLTARAAELVLGAYFKQIFESQTWMLDFRKERWVFQDHKLVWCPGTYFHVPSDGFREAVKGLYRGFYREDRRGFSDSLRTLGIAPAEVQILSHFGLAQQVAVRFSLAELQRSFSEIFKACEVHHSRIHPEFALLGAMLISLYDVLESAGVAIDVRSVFARVVEK